jgi:hypothetical protein
MGDQQDDGGQHDGYVIDAYVHVGGALYKPGDRLGHEVPPEHAALIRNPACWLDGRLPPAEQPDPPPEGGGQDPTGDRATPDKGPAAGEEPMAPPAAEPDRPDGPPATAATRRRGK